jgi:hypothetical protein
MKRNLLSLMALLFLVQSECLLAADCGTRDYESSPYYQSVITSHYIRIAGEGRIDVSHETTLLLFNQDDILDAVQRAYAHLLKEGEQPEFVVKQHGEGNWNYVNKSGNRSEIMELHRCAEPNRPSKLVLYTKGERFFGDFQAVIVIQFRLQTETACSYQVEVFAYPRSAISRFFARRLGIAERYFRTKTAEMIELSVRICSILTEWEEKQQAAPAWPDGLETARIGSPYHPDK